MSATPEGETPLARHIARRKAEEQCDAEAAVIGAERERIWQDRLVGPVTEFVPRWADVWERFAAELRAGNSSDAADQFLALDDLLTELHGLYVSWCEARDAWFRDRARPWNERYPDGGRFGRMNPHHQPDWVFCWVRDACRSGDTSTELTGGPAAIPGRAAGWLADATPPWRAGEGHEAVYLLGLLGAAPVAGGRDARREEVARCLAELSDRERVAGISLVLAAVVLPSPEIVARFFAAGPSDDVVAFGNWVVQVTSAVVGEWLRAEFARQDEARRPAPAAGVAAAGEEPTEQPSGEAAPECCGIPAEWLRPPPAPDDWPGQLRAFAGVTEALAGMVSTIDETIQPQRPESNARTVAERWREAQFLGDRVGDAPPPEPETPTMAAFRNALYGLAAWARGAADRASQSPPTREPTESRTDRVRPATADAGGVPVAVRNWLVSRYLANPTPEQFGEPSPGPVVFERFEVFADFLAGLGADVMATLVACRRVGWIDDVMVELTIGEGEEPAWGIRRLGLPLGRHRLVGIRGAVLDVPSAPGIGASPAREEPAPPPLPPRPTAALMASADLTAALGLPESRANAVDVALRKYADRNRGCRESVENPRRGEPRYLYRVDEVWPMLLERLPGWRAEDG